MKTYAKGQMIYLPADPAKTIYFLKKGKVKISKYSDDGRELTKAILGPGELFGELSLAGADKRDEVAEVVDDAMVCIIHESDFRSYLAHHPRLNIKVTKLIGLRLKKVESRLESLYFKTSAERVQEFIKDLADNYGTKRNGEVEVKLYLTHNEIAKLTANSRQNVTTILRSLEKDGIIYYDRKRIIIKKYDQL